MSRSCRSCARTLGWLVGCALIGQSTEIAPVDRKLYALRNATGTVDSIPLIAASIMSKKLAEDLTGLVLDIKRGSGSFLPALDRCIELAQLMIELGASHGCPATTPRTPAGAKRSTQRSHGWSGLDTRCGARA